jgi:DNA mismatch endonuclease, patch repair protein
MLASDRYRRMAAVKSKNTKPELLVRGILHGLGFRYRLHIESLPGKPDIVFSRKRKVIFVHGCFWHGHHCKRGIRIPTDKTYWLPKLERNAERDKKDQQALAKLGWKVLVIWECETKSHVELVDRLKKFLNTDDASFVDLHP